MTNFLYFIFPSLFGCRRAVFTGLGGDEGLRRMLEALQKLGAVKTGETGLGYFDNYYFKLGGKPVGLIFEEYQELKVIAPAAVIARIESSLGSKSVAVSRREFCR